MDSKNNSIDPKKLFRYYVTRNQYDQSIPININDITKKDYKKFIDSNHKRSFVNH